MSVQQQLMVELRSQLKMIHELLAETAVALDETIKLLHATCDAQQIPIQSPTQVISAPVSLSDEVPLRDQLTFKGKPIPAGGSAAAGLVATARAEAAELKRVAAKCTESE